MRHAIFFFLLAGCGPNAVDDIAPMDGGIFFDATVPPRDASPFSDGGADAWVDTGVFNGGGPFLCQGCICDGTLDMCIFGGGGGGMPVASDASTDADADVGEAGEAGACDPDAGQPFCQQIPVGCLPKPTCACITPFVTPCTCAVDSAGDGFVITCPPKP